MKKSVTAWLLLLILLSCSGGEKKNDPKNRLKYVNLKYRFTLQFPEKWINYMDFEKNEIIDPQIIIPVVYFALASRSREWQPLNVPAGYADLFYVRIFTKAQWKLYQERYRGSEEMKMSDRFPGERGDFVYMIRYSISLPVDLYLYMKDSVAITETFRILKEK